MYRVWFVVCPCGLEEKARVFLCYSYTCLSFLYHPVHLTFRFLASLRIVFVGAFHRCTEQKQDLAGRHGSLLIWRKRNQKDTGGSVSPKVELISNVCWR
jgi:hypothetical protein